MRDLCGWARLDQMLKLKYLGCVLDGSGEDVVGCCRKVVSGRKVAGAIRSLINVRSLQLECCMKHCSCLLCRTLVRQ